LLRVVDFLYAGYMMLLFLFVLGLCVGSFLNVLADRLPKGEDVLKSRSHCDYCKHKLRWYELVPLLSIILQQGKSRCCKKRLSVQYPLVELAAGIGFVLIYSYQLFLLHQSYGGQAGGQAAFSFQMDIQSLLNIVRLISYFVLLSSFLVIFISDLKYEIIPIEMIIVGSVAALGMVFFDVAMVRSNLPAEAGNLTVLNHFFSAIGAGLFFFGIWFFTKGKAMGDGDIYLASLIGFLLGFPDIIVSLYAAFLTGALVGIILVLGRKKSLKAHIPFGPFLIAGYGITVLWGDTILRIWRLLW
jgi:leader peptidase (prepilin peptidase)/N-methyltransferase